MFSRVRQVAKPSRATPGPWWSSGVNAGPRCPLWGLSVPVITLERIFPPGDTGVFGGAQALKLVPAGLEVLTFVDGRCAVLRALFDEGALGALFHFASECRLVGALGGLEGLAVGLDDAAAKIVEGVDAGVIPHY